MSLGDLLWTLPGFIILEIYNRKHPASATSLSGWRYVFCLVAIAAMVWLPAQWVAKTAAEWLAQDIRLTMFWSIWLGTGTCLYLLWGRKIAVSLMVVVAASFLLLLASHLDVPDILLGIAVSCTFLVLVLPLALLVYTLCAERREVQMNPLKRARIIIIVLSLFCTLLAGLLGCILLPDMQMLKTVVMVIPLSAALLVLTSVDVIASFILPKSQDLFYNRCVEWENEEVIISLKNNKIYYGLLWKYPENPLSDHSLQTLSIVPFTSGCRSKSGQVVWNTVYPILDDSFSHNFDEHEYLKSTELIIPRSEITSFRKFNPIVFEYFASKSDPD